jgi:hypothetical protein
MFNCNFCKKTSGPGKPAHRVVTKTRTRTYEPRGVGTEIVEEQLACGDCYLGAKDVPTT